MTAILSTAHHREANATDAARAPILWKSPQMHPVNVTVTSFLLQGPGKRRPCRLEFQIEVLTRLAGNLQPATYDFATRMPEIDHPQ